MPTISTARTVSMGHRLPTYAGRCSSPHGHNVRAEVTVETSAFLDFKAVDAALAAALDPLDHAMVLWDQDPLLPTLQVLGFRTVGLSVEPTTENLAAYLFNVVAENLRLAPGFPAPLSVLSVVVHETDKYSAGCYSANGVRRTS